MRKRTDWMHRCIRKTKGHRKREMLRIIISCTLFSWIELKDACRKRQRGQEEIKKKRKEKQILTKFSITGFG